MTERRAQVVLGDGEFTLGPWRVVPRRNVICRGGEERHVENRLMQTLLFLVQHRGEVVTRNQFFDAVWQGRVVNEEALSRAISLLRTLLGDDASSPSFIQTIPGVGYRLIAEVHPGPDSADRPAPDEPDRAVMPPRPSFRKYVDRALMVVLALTIAYSAVDRLILQPKTIEPEGRTAQPAGLAGDESAGEPSIAVLPFVNMSSDPEQDYFADGMTEEILNLLAGISNLRVTARTSAFFFKGRDVPVASIADLLNVEHVLEGSVRKSGNRIRITAQLIEANSDRHLWSQTYDRELEDVFKIQDEVASAIAEALLDSFDSLQVDPVTHTASLAAFEAYRTGRLLWWRRNPEDLKTAIALFHEAIENDPGFAPAYAAVADSWLLLVLYGEVHIMKGVDEARPMIEQALAINPNSADALAARGLSLLIIGEKDLGERDLRQAIKLDADYIPAYAWLAALLGDLGRIPEQGAILQSALAKDPLNEVLTSNYAENLRLRGEADDALKLTEGLLRMQPDAPTLLVTQSETALAHGDLVTAWSAADRAYTLAPENTAVIIAMARAWLALGAGAEAEQVLRAGLEVSPRNVNIKVQYLEFLMFSGRIAEAEQMSISTFGKHVDGLPDAIQRTYHYHTGMLHLVQSQIEQARDHLSLALNPDETRLYDDNQVRTLTFVALLSRFLGDEEEAERRLRMVERVIGHARVNGIADAQFYYSVACVFALRGERASALQALQQSYDLGWRNLWLLDNDIRLDAIRSETGFAVVRDLVALDVQMADESIRQLQMLAQAR